MTCAELESLLCDYVDGTLSAEARAALEVHLRGCQPCAEMARDAVAAVGFLKQASPVEPPGELMTKLLFLAPDGRHSARGRAPGLRSFWRGWVQPLLQPRLAMGMAMTILSFSLLGKFAGIPDRPLQPEDLHPMRVWSALDDSLHKGWDRAVKYYESLRLVYEIQSRLREWTEEEEDRSTPSAAPAQTEATAPETREQWQGIEEVP